MGNCINCKAYDEVKSQCHRYPKVVEKLSDDWCLEFKEKEVITNAIEKGEIQESSIEEHRRIDELWTSTKAGDSDSNEESREIQKEEVRKRGWPKGKPRKINAPDNF